MTEQEITIIINKIWDAVSKSKTGEIMSEEKKEIRVVGFQTFLTILGNTFPKEMVATGEMEIREPKENWEQK